jgi:TIGR03009 family protein
MLCHFQLRFFAVLAVSLLPTFTTAQQQAAPLAQPQQLTPTQPPAVAVAPQLPPEFNLNPIEQTYLDQVLAAWETSSAKINQFECPFERWEYNKAFGPAADKPLSIEKGKLSYRKPDKGSFEITEIMRWQAKPVPPGQAPPAVAEGEYTLQPDAVGEHWVCDGKSVFEYRHDQKQLVERPIPLEMQGQAIVDGPLPFLFGAEAKKLKARYWMRIEPRQSQEEICIQALPKWQTDAADYSKVEVILDRQQLLPKAMQVHLPNRDRHVYMFVIKDASINGHLQRIMAMFEAPRTPFGWKRVVEQPPAQPPNRQAAEPEASGDVQR